MQPSVSAIIEVTLWFAVFRFSNTETVAGFSLNHYLSYAIWATFIGRITSNWMYEFRMSEEIETGTLNGLLVRPLSFFEYYLSQFLGYKIITTLISLVVPILVVMAFKLPTDLSKLPIVFALIGYYLIFVHCLSFVICTAAFHFTKTHSLTVAKNLGLWILSGELIPIDLIPEPYQTWILNLPFANAIYIPIAYLTGRSSIDLVWHGFFTTTIGILCTSILGYFFWKKGLKSFVGTGA
jgi:ABC-2 type transport system permease protein